ncbi:uncharacterized protein KY384_008523 [Bacidia gigantensis]|uniref:uncharacterized protein n=1 Tax=Bacidia gigantensis TaxID=2732470 RepID=UPI001D053060|nr:uncharacterized protein KY384_008523 [Bacidia gigantensis]KAG8527094.1 hypothetical protein KY384_008523 [Bacidia gigantensis]
MSATIPSALKAADVARFAHRAGQLERARPAVAYWCNYWIVEQIISKGLHKADEDSTGYTMSLVDKLEQTKIDFAENDAIVDDTAGHAYVEQFAQETFQRAENAMKANKVSRQTADTFQAASTFFELNQIWGPLEQETTSKIKYAKYHALRIAKALKAGEDPNASNPVVEIISSNDQPIDDSTRSTDSNINGHSTHYQQPTVEEDRSGRPSPEVPSTGHPAPEENYYHQSTAPDVSPLAPSSAEVNDPRSSEYFPPMPQHSEASPVIHQPAPTVPSSSRFSNSSPILGPPPNDAQSDFPTSTRSPDLPPAMTYDGPTKVSSSPDLPRQHSSLTQQVENRPVRTQYKDDDASVLSAQRHAKFAISALNFEDVPTAVEELQAALEALGAT